MKEKGRQEQESAFGSESGRRKPFIPATKQTHHQRGLVAVGFLFLSKVDDECFEAVGYKHLLGLGRRAEGGRNTNIESERRTSLSGYLKVWDFIIISLSPSHFLKVQNNFFFFFLQRSVHESSSTKGWRVRKKTQPNATLGSIS